MSTHTQTIGRDDTAVDPADTTAARLLNRHSIWLRPEDATSLLNLRLERRIPYLAARDLANNTTRTLLWRPAIISRRAGNANPEALKPALRQYEASGLTDAVEPGTPGRPARVTFPSVEAHRIAVPHALIWRHKAIDTGAPHALRYGAATAAVVSAVIVELASVVGGHGGCRYTHGGLVWTTERSLADKATAAGVGLASYRRWWRVLREINPPWLSIENVPQPGGGVGLCRVTIDWRVLEGYETPPSNRSKVTGGTFEQGGDFRTDDGDDFRTVPPVTFELGVGGLSNTPYKEEVPLSEDPHLSPPPKSSHSRPQVLRTAATNQNAEGEEERSHPINQELLTTVLAPDRDTAYKRLKNSINSSGGSRHQLPLGDWCALLIANLVHAPHDKRLTLTLHEALALADTFAPLHAAGWDALAVAEALTRTSSANVDSAARILRHRLKALGSTPIPVAAADDRVWLVPEPGRDAEAYQDWKW